MKTRIRVVLADDHTVLRVGLGAFLGDQTDPVMEIVGQASSGEEAIELVEALRPDLLLIDLAMPGLGGVGATIELRRRDSSAKILVLTQYAETAYLRRVLEAGADGYILKTARGEELISAIRAVIQGGTYIDPSLAGKLVSRVISKEEPPASEEEAYQRLTPRELQVLKLVAEGFSNKEIANALDIAVKTAMTHRANLMDKTGIRNRSKLIQFAIRMGLITVE